MKFGKHSLCRKDTILRVIGTDQKNKKVGLVMVLSVTVVTTSGAYYIRRGHSMFVSKVVFWDWS